MWRDLIAPKLISNGNQAIQPLSTIKKCAKRAIKSAVKVLGEDALAKYEGTLQGRISPNICG